MSSHSFIPAIVKLGHFLNQFKEEEFNPSVQLKELNDKHADNFSNIIEKTNYKNPWFTPESIRLSFSAWSDILTEEKLNEWLSAYNLSKIRPASLKVGLIMAGNIPLVGFHDFLSVIMSGHIALVKLSSKDDVLLPAIFKVLCDLDKEFTNRVEFTEDHLKTMDAVIATGSDNSSRYFEYYFGKYPHIIRKNRNSIAVLSGSESDEQLKLLADDVFMYFGLGCRNVSKIYLPENFNPTRMD